MAINPKVVIRAEQEAKRRASQILQMIAAAEAEQSQPSTQAKAAVNASARTSK